MGYRLAEVCDDTGRGHAVLKDAARRLASRLAEERTAAGRLDAERQLKTVRRIMLKRGDMPAEVRQIDRALIGSPPASASATARHTLPPRGEIPDSIRSRIPAGPSPASARPRTEADLYRRAFGG